MKAITIWQPWAWLIVNGYKSVENRTWRTKHRGPLAIHAGNKRMSAAEYETIRERFSGPAGRVPDIPDQDELDYGKIVGHVELVDCVPFDEGWEWDNYFAEGPVCWLLADAKRCVRPRSFCGRQMLFDVASSLVVSG